jgi:hypothetical protein
MDFTALQRKMKMTNRKFWLAGAILVIATILCVLHFLDGTQWVTAASLIYGGYAASNVASKGKVFPVDGSGGQPAD